MNRHLPLDHTADHVKAAVGRGSGLRVLEPDHTGDGPIVLGDLMLVIAQRDDVSETNPQPGRSILNFHVDDFALFETQLNAAGASWIETATDRPSGRFATFEDPDGNYLQIIKFNQPPS